MQTPTDNTQLGLSAGGRDRHPSISVFDIKLRGQGSVRNMGRFLSLGMIDSEEMRQRERGTEKRVEVRPMIDEDRPVGLTYRQQKKQKTKQQLLKPYVDGRKNRGGLLREISV